ncbi:MAG: Ppx/GppA family phosphatase [candidate division KSB1 bacterium]|nr:Ppx/GppA family phosphatase [candidate division KSB1 bacterium]MDZ7303925.1 Ppx/GppA family phosphatase [candidate division KSB1 bacterium]
MTNPHKLKKRLASFDLGTNTFLLLIADVEGTRVEPLFEKETVVRLGKGVDMAGNLNAEAMQRGIACLQEYVALAEQYGAEQILAVGTSALREATNRGEFLSLAFEKTGVKIRILSGENEARLSFAGAISNKPNLPSLIAVLDIGGGSTEIVIGEPRLFSAAGENVLNARSADIGAVRLTERFVHSDPVQPEEVMQIYQHTKAALCKTWSKDELGRVKTIIGTAGTITTLAAMTLALQAYDPHRVDGYVLTRQQLGEIIIELTRRTLAQRRQMPGLNPARADVILAGALILEAAMDVYCFPEILVSDRGLRHGVLVAEACTR